MNCNQGKRGVLRWIYRKAMFRAMGHACNRGWDEIYANKAPLKYGLYVIKRFEVVNGIRFNPLSPKHLRAVRGNRTIASLHYLQIALRGMRANLMK